MYDRRAAVAGANSFTIIRAQISRVFHRLTNIRRTKIPQACLRPILDAPRAPLLRCKITMGEFYLLCVMQAVGAVFAKWA